MNNAVSFTFACQLVQDPNEHLLQMIAREQARRWAWLDMIGCEHSGDLALSPNGSVTCLSCNQVIKDSFGLFVRSAALAKLLQPEQPPNPDPCLCCFNFPVKKFVS